MEVKWSYFQYRKSYQYPVYLRIKADDLNSKFQHLFHEMGFQDLSDAETKKIQLTRLHTKMLTIQNATPRMELQINGSDLLDKYGHESMAIQLGLPIYTYRKVGLMGVPSHSSLWDLALKSGLSTTEQMVGVRIILVRFLSLALADQGVLAYWGTVKDGNLIIMKQAQSFGEAILIDLEKKMIFSNGGETKFSSALQIIRKDIESRVARSMGREELISFMSVSTCLLNFHGITLSMKRAIYEMSAHVKASYAISEAFLNL